jgi:SNF2 family DNA or RNA helicase
MSHTARLDARKIVLRFDYDSRLVGFCHTLPDPRFDRSARTWTCTATPYAAYRIKEASFDCDPDILRLAELWIFSQNRLDGPAYESRTKPWPHQDIGFGFAINRYAAMLAMDMGTGKSKTAIDLLTNRDCRNVLILCPRAVIDVWPKQFDLHGPSTDHYRLLPLTGGTTKAKAKKAEDHRKVFSARRRVVIVNYESAWRSELAKWLLDQQWDAVLLDESHRIKSPRGKASMFCAKLRQRADFRLCLTGTPMPHSPLDLFGQYRFLEPAILGTSFTRFRQKFAICDQKFPSRVLEWVNQEELSGLFNMLSYQCKAADVLDLPERMFHDVPVQLSAKTQKVYSTLRDEMIVEIGNGVLTVANALTKLLRLQQITSGFTYLDADDPSDKQLVELDTSKRDALSSLLTDLAAHEPIVVFARFTHDLQAIRQAAEASGVGREYRELSGRTNELRQWQEESGGSVLGVQIQSGGVGIDLTRARYGVYYSVGYSMGDYDQSLARIYRPGQDRTTHVYRLVCPGSVDACVYKAFSERRSAVEAVLQDMSTLLTPSGV